MTVDPVDQFGTVIDETASDFDERGAGLDAFLRALAVLDVAVGNDGEAAVAHLVDE